MALGLVLECEYGITSLNVYFYNLYNSNELANCWGMKNWLKRRKDSKERFNWIGQVVLCDFCILGLYPPEHIVNSYPMLHFYLGVKS